MVSAQSRRGENNWCSWFGTVVDTTMSSTVVSVVRMTTRAGPIVLLARRGFVKTGEKVPINYVKGTWLSNKQDSMISRHLKLFLVIFATDMKPITILDDKEYPEWVFKLSETVSGQGLSIRQLGSMILCCLHSCQVRLPCSRNTTNRAVIRCHIMR
jgi:hypothetical protein